MSKLSVTADEGVKLTVRLQAEEGYRGHDKDGNPVFVWIDKRVDNLATSTREYDLAKGERLIVEQG